MSDWYTCPVRCLLRAEADYLRALATRFENTADDLDAAPPDPQLEGALHMFMAGWYAAGGTHNRQIDDVLCSLLDGWRAGAASPCHTMAVDNPALAAPQPAGL